MNKEANFYLRFVVKDLAKMKKAQEEVIKRLDLMQKNANKASSSVNKMNTSFGKAVRSLSKFALAYFALSKIISTVFSKATESIQIDMIAASAGVAAEKIGKLGKALRIYGGDAKSAGSAYASLTEIIGGAQHGMGISEDVQRVNAMYGIGFNYGNISQDQLLTNIAVSMQRLKGQGNQWGINQIAKAYGLDSSMANFLAEQGANWSNVRNREKWEKLGKSETRQLIESQESLKEEYAKLADSLAPALIAGLQGLNSAIEALTPPITSIARFFGYKNQEERKDEERVKQAYEKHKGEFIGWDEIKKAGSLTMDLAPVHKDAYERAQYVMDKLRESNYSLKVLGEYQETARRLEKDYGKDYGFNIGMLPQNDGSAVVSVQVGDIVIQDKTSFGVKAKQEKSVQVNSSRG